MCFVTLQGDSDCELIICLHVGTKFTFSVDLEVIKSDTMYRFWIKTLCQYHKRFAERISIFALGFLRLYS